MMSIIRSNNVRKAVPGELKLGSAAGVMRYIFNLFKCHAKKLSQAGKMFKRVSRTVTSTGKSRETCRIRPRDRIKRTAPR